MIVYGDPQFTVPLDVFARRLLDLLDETAVPSADAADAARRLLIACGQCEQGVEDACAEADIPASTAMFYCAAIRRATDTAAELFLDAISLPQSFCKPPSIDACKPALRDFAESASELRLTIKVPEGYAFYRLMPERYVLAVENWQAARAASPRESAPVTVIGLRSIGTSLSAVVAATLRRNGISDEVRRVTVRPHGHPFDRSVALPASILDWRKNSDYALIVDEGPGLSGSSMAAVYHALVDSGYARERIALFPGHDGMPGGQGSAAVQQVWAEAPGFVGCAEDLRRHGETIQQRLLRRARQITELASAPESVPENESPEYVLHDLGGGAWRRFSYPAGEGKGWPAVSLQFERPKYLCRRAGASSGGVVWTYVGLSEILDADGAIINRERSASARMNYLASLGFSSSAFAAECGFVASPWIDGERLTSSDYDAAPVARYCAAASLPPLNAQESSEAWERLRGTLYWNTKETLGDAAAEKAARLADEAANMSMPSIAASGDGRMAPHEWVRCADGKVVKIDCAGRDYDHTIIGRQPIWWDLAGASVEWKLQSVRRAELWRLVQGNLHHGADRFVSPGDAVGRFYLAAYSVFRIGLLSMNQSEEEAPRSESALEEYRRELASNLCL